MTHKTLNKARSRCHCRTCLTGNTGYIRRTLQFSEELDLERAYALLIDRRFKKIESKP